jgi:hypothetical protein
MYCSLAGRFDKSGYRTGPSGYIGWRFLSRKLKSRYGARNGFQEPNLKLRLAGRYDNPMPNWFLAPIAVLKLPTLGSLNVYKFGLCSFKINLTDGADPCSLNPDPELGFSSIRIQI